jgi:PhzF family phenazine biosynthesis protein
MNPWPATEAMKLTLFQVDAFASRVFEGNPAAVCPLNEWLPDEVMQSIALENNLSETAFFVPEGGEYAIRWFTPVAEVDLCGHATLASAWVLFNRLGHASDRLRFSSRSGPLEVARDGERLVLDFPAQPPRPCAAPPGLAEALGAEPLECLENVDLLAVLEDAETVRSLSPDFGRLAALDYRGVIVTAAGGGYDFVSRFFGPAVGVPEDPVTGSAHTKLVPFWASRLNRNRLEARQVSARGGNVSCRLRGDRVLIAGTAVPYLEGTIEI